MSKFCCKVLPEILKEFNWFTYNDEKTNEEVFLMPYIETREGVKWKINHCPSCGENIKSIKVNYDELYGHS